MTIKLEQNIATKRSLMTWNHLISMDDQCIIYEVTHRKDIAIEKYTHVVCAILQSVLLKLYNWNIFSINFRKNKFSFIIFSSMKTHNLNFKRLFCIYFHDESNIVGFCLFFLACLNYHRTGGQCCQSINSFFILIAWLRSLFEVVKFTLINNILYNARIRWIITFQKGGSNLN